MKNQDREFQKNTTSQKLIGQTKPSVISDQKYYYNRNPSYTNSFPTRENQIKKSKKSHYFASLEFAHQNPSVFHSRAKNINSQNHLDSLIHNDHTHSPEITGRTSRIDEKSSRGNLYAEDESGVVSLQPETIIINGECYQKVRGNAGSSFGSDAFVTERDNIVPLIEKVAERGGGASDLGDSRGAHSQYYSPFFNGTLASGRQKNTGDMIDDHDLS